jgi:hypothetical protein
VVNVNSDTAIGVFLDSSPGCSFRWAMLYGSYGRAFSVERSSGSRFAHARVHGTAAEAALTFTQSSGVRVSPCSLVCVAPASVVLGDSCNDDTLARMTILGTTDVGIAALDCRGLVLANNCIRGWTDLGVALRNVRSPRLCYNTIVSPESTGNVVIDLANVIGAEVRDNIVWNRGRYGSTCYDVSEAFPFAPGASDYNDLYASAGSVARVGDTVFLDLPAWRGHSSTPDGHSISRDPLFVPDDNYHLSSASPCRDSGIPVAGFLYDIDLDERDTLAPDIGADEFTPGAVSEARPAPGCFGFELRGNPTNHGCMTIAAGLTSGTCLNVSIVDVAGRIVREQRVPVAGRQQGIDFGELRPGVYLVRVSAGRLSAARKLVVQR